MKSWVLDLDGVIWRGDEPVRGSADAVAALRNAGVSVLFVTNSAVRTPADVAAKLARHGIPDAQDSVVTSAMAAATLVDAGERVVVVGSGGLRSAVIDRGAEIVESGPADAVLVGLTHDFHYDDITRAMTAIRAGARFVAANGDTTFPVADGLLPGAGALSAAVATAAGVEPTVAGKPHPPVADLVRTRLGPEGIMVGDRPETDGAFAKVLGYHFGLVLSGVTRRGDLPVEPTPDLVADDLSDLVTALLAPG
ncbi:MAG: HAD-IIA family hydrolase [Actinomycetota bacterium]